MDVVLCMPNGKTMEWEWYGEGLIHRWQGPPRDERGFPIADSLYLLEGHLPFAVSSPVVEYRDALFSDFTPQAARVTV